MYFGTLCIPMISLCKNVIPPLLRNWHLKNTPSKLIRLYTFVSPLSPGWFSLYAYWFVVGQGEFSLFANWCGSWYWGSLSCFINWLSNLEDFLFPLIDLVIGWGGFLFLLLVLIISLYKCLMVEWFRTAHNELVAKHPKEWVKHIAYK